MANSHAAYNDDDLSDPHKEYNGPLGSKATSAQLNIQNNKRSRTSSDEEEEPCDPNADPTDCASRQATVWEAKSKATVEEEIICNTGGESGHFAEAAIKMTNAEETPPPRVRLGILFQDRTLPPSWWHLLDERTHRRYYWNSMTNIKQNMRPTTCPTCRSYIQRRMVSGHEMDPYPRAWQVLFPNRTGMAYSDVASLTRNVPLLGRSRFSFYVSILLPNSKLKWYHLNLSGDGGHVKDHGSKIDFITPLLDEVSQDTFGTFVVLNSSIYWSNYSPTRSESSLTSEVQVTDLANPDRQSWKEFTPLVKPRVNPWAVNMGDTLYVVGAKSEIGFSSSKQLIYIDVLTDPESRKWESFPLHLPPKICWSNCFVVAFDDQCKLVIGTPHKNYLYIYDVRTHNLEKIRIDGLDLIPWGRNRPPVIVGNILFFFFGATLLACDLVKKSLCYGEIDGVCHSSFWVIAITMKICLICLRSRKLEFTSTVHCFLFDVREFAEQDGQRLHGNLCSIDKFYVGYSESLWSVFVM